MPPAPKQLELEFPFKLQIVTLVSEKGCSWPICGQRSRDAGKRAVVMAPPVLCVSYREILDICGFLDWLTRLLPVYVHKGGNLTQVSAPGITV